MYLRACWLAIADGGCCSCHVRRPVEVCVINLLLVAFRDRLDPGALARGVDHGLLCIANGRDSEARYVRRLHTTFSLGAIERGLCWGLLRLWFWILFWGLLITRLGSRNDLC